LTGREAGLAEERGLLVAGDPVTGSARPHSSGVVS
jgi:hypothetical protein